MISFVFLRPSHRRAGLKRITLSSPATFARLGVGPALGFVFARCFHSLWYGEQVLPD